jgi:phenylacetic acid degradation operon negative regulatory protein
MPTNGQRPGDVRRRSGPGLVAFLFGAAAREELPATVLVRLLGDLGIGETSARTVLSRLRQAGFLAGRTEGRRVQLRLDGVGAAAFGRSRASSKAAVLPQWDGVLHGILYTFPENHRSFRDALRRTAVLAGYGALRPGLLVCPFDRWESVLAATGPPPANTTAYPVALTMDPETAATAAAEAWDLTAIAQEFTASIQLLRSLPEAPTGTGRDAFRTFVSTLRPIYQSFVRDPALPAELVGPDWPLAALAQELQTVLSRWHPPITRYIADLTGADST